MLVLDRRVHEGFWIEGGIFVKVLSVGRNRVKLGIEAPGDVKIVREELRERQENQPAAPATENGRKPPKGSLRSARGRN